jgi:NADPH2:quinone reductase
VPINLILLKSCQVVGVFYGAWSARFPDESRANFRDILNYHRQGRIKPLVGAEYPLADYAAALRCLMERRAIGKVVVNVR